MAHLLHRAAIINRRLNKYEVMMYYCNEYKRKHENLSNFQKSATLVFFDIKIESF